MKDHLKQAAFVLAVFAIAKLVNRSVTIPVIGDYLPS
jgi:hypothetical protein